MTVFSEKKKNYVNEKIERVLGRDERNEQIQNSRC